VHKVESVLQEVRVVMERLVEQSEVQVEPVVHRVLEAKRMLED
jgi:archaellum component FlaC